MRVADNKTRPKAKSKDNRGGAREGSGRKRIGDGRIYMTVPTHVQAVYADHKTEARAVLTEWADSKLASLSQEREYNI